MLKNQDSFTTSHKIIAITKISFVTLFFTLFGIGLMFLSQEEASTTIFIVGLICTLLFGGTFLIWMILLLVFPKKSWEKYQRSQKSTSKNSYATLISNPYSADINNLLFLKKNPTLLIPYVVSLLVIISVLVLEFTNFFLLDLIKFLPLYPLVLSFICFSIFILGYIALAEMLQRKFSKAKHSFFYDMTIGYCYSIPFIVILSFLWIIFVFVGDKKHKTPIISVNVALKRLALYQLMVLVKYYTYINLAMIAFEDKHTYSLKESLEFFEKERKKLFIIWFQAGALIGLPFLLVTGLWMWNLRFHFMNDNIILILGIISLLSYFVIGMLSEQLSFLRHFITSRHKNINVGK